MPKESSTSKIWTASNFASTYSFFQAPGTKLIRLFVLTFNSFSKFFCCILTYPSCLSNLIHRWLFLISLCFVFQIKLKSFHIAAWPWHHHRSHLSFQLRLAFPSVRWSSFNVKRSRTVIIYEKGVIGGWMTGWFNCLGVVFFLIFLIPDIGTRQNLHRHNH